MADGVWTFELCDPVDTVLADITGYVTATVSPRLNRPFTLVLNGPSDQDVWKTIHTDGDRYLTEGTRTVKAKRNGVLIANVEIWRLDYAGNQNTQTVQISCSDSMIRAGFRLVRDSVGRVDSWIFPDSIAAGAMVQQLLQNSVTYDDALRTGQVTAPRIFPIDASIAGNFTAATDVAEQLNDGPMLLGDLLYTRICDTGVADAVVVPTDTTAGSAPGIYGILHCVDAWGSDKTGTVHFDYDAGANNVKTIRRSFDMATSTNWLRYLLTPKLSPDHWRGSLESPDTALGTTSYRDAEYAAAVKYGALLSWQAFDSDANNVRAFYRALWKAETTLRVHPRQLLYLTPAANSAFEPFADYNIGDRIATNIGDSVGPALTNAIQRIYGFDLTINVNGVEDPGELIASPDGASA